MSRRWRQWRPVRPLRWLVPKSCTVVTSFETGKTICNVIYIFVRANATCVLQTFFIFVTFLMLVSLSASMALLLYLRKTVVNYTSFIDLYLYNIFSREVTFSCFIGICVNLLTNICIDFLNHELHHLYLYKTINNLLLFICLPEIKETFKKRFIFVS